MRTALATVAATLCLAACSSRPAVLDSGTGTPADTGVATDAVDHRGGAGGPVPPSSTETYRIQPGVGIPATGEAVGGFSITANVGGSYRLIWAGAGVSGARQQEFYGSVYTAGTFASVEPGCSGGSCALEANDFVSAAQSVAGGQRIDFDGFAGNDLDGLDFVASTEPVYFDLYIDGAHYPMAVRFPEAATGGQTAVVSVIPFGLTTQ